MTTDASRELNPPPIARESGAKELLRVWAGPDLPQQSVLSMTWSDPGMWGITLIDIARHAAKAYTKVGFSEQEAFDRILQFWEAELKNPTDTPRQLEPDIPKRQ